MDNATHRKRIPQGGVSVAVVALAVSGAAAGVIDNATFFDSVPHTTITFETDGNGDPVTLLQGQRLEMPADEYAALGVRFSPAVFWINDGNLDFDAAQFLGGSPPVAIPSGEVDEFEILFDVPVLAVGAFIVNNRAIDPSGPIFTALDAGGNVLEQVSFGPAFHDGSIGIADYGFMGLMTDEPIAALRVQKQSAILDDLTFSPVPTPGTVFCLGLAGLVAMRRKR